MYVLSLVSTNCTRPGLQCARAHQRTAQFQLLRIPQHSGVAAGQERQDSAFQSPKSLKTCLIPLEINYFGLIVSLVFIFIINCRQRVGVFKEEEILNRLFFLSFGSAQNIWRRELRTFSKSVFGVAIQDDRHRFGNGEIFLSFTQINLEVKVCLLKISAHCLCL